MPQGSIDNTFNGLATTREFHVKDVITKSIKLRDQAIDYLKHATNQFEKGLTKSEDGHDNVSYLHDKSSLGIQDSLGSIAYSLECLRLRQAAVDLLLKLPNDIKVLELDFTKDLSEEVIRAVYKKAAEKGKQSEMTYVVPHEIKKKLAL